jgi:hypothetical protein
MSVSWESVNHAVCAAEQFLTNAQNPDGLWRDYLLAPGASMAWTTGCVGWSLANLPMGGGQRHAVHAASEALRSIRCSRGWGYNSDTAPDADTTAWVLRVMAKVADPLTRDATRYLEPFVSDSGGVRTFQQRDRFGNWAQEHADVTPVVGLALVECGADGVLVNRMRDWSMAKQRPDGGWSSFWWSTDCYATARNLEFLDSSGGIPSRVRDGCREWLRNQDAPRSAFEGANQLMIMVTVGMREETGCAPFVNALLRSQMSDGSWPASTVLRVPDQREENGDDIPTYRDAKRLMSTAMMDQSLKVWLRAGETAPSGGKGA